MARASLADRQVAVGVLPVDRRPAGVPAGCGAVVDGVGVAARGCGGRRGHQQAVGGGIKGELTLRLPRRPVPSGAPAVCAGSAKQVVADGRLVHDPVVDALEPVIEPALDLSTIVEVGCGRIDLAVVERPHQKTLGHSKVAVQKEGVAREEVIPASYEVDRHARGVDAVKQRVGGSELPQGKPAGYLAVAEREGPPQGVGQGLPDGRTAAFGAGLRQYAAISVAVYRGDDAGIQHGG